MTEQVESHFANFFANKEVKDSAKMKLCATFVLAHAHRLQPEQRKDVINAALDAAMCTYLLENIKQLVEGVVEGGSPRTGLSVFYREAYKQSLETTDRLINLMYLIKEAVKGINEDDLPNS